MISATEWAKLESGITQRVVALERFLDDIYGDQEILRDGVIPRRLISSCEHFHREAAGITRPTASVSTWPASTSSATPRAPSGSSRTIFVRRRESPTSWRTAG